MWEVYAYHNSDALYGLFNAVAAMMGAANFAAALGAVLFCGFVTAALAYAFEPEKLAGWKWLATVVLVYSALILPKVAVGIVDKTGGTPVKIVDNVPFGLAAIASIPSTIGNGITELFETAFQVVPGTGALPAELSYQYNGLMFGSRLLQHTRALRFNDPSVATSLMNFVHNCTFFDMADGTIPVETYADADDLWPLMKDTNPARFTVVSTPAGTELMTCTQAYAAIDAAINVQLPRIQDALALRMHPTVPAALAKAAIAGEVQQAYISSQIAAGSGEIAAIIRQNALINAINDSTELSCQKVGDPACMAMATGRAAAVAQQNAVWTNGGKIAQHALPIIRNGGQALILAVFPLLVLMLMLTHGQTTVKALGGYLLGVISFELWPPLFAVLNYLASIYAAFDQAAAAEVGEGLKVLSLRTASPIYTNAISAQAVVAWLVMAIPLLAWKMTNLMRDMGAPFASMLTGLQSVVGNQSSLASTGNMKLGDVSMDQQTISPRHASAFAQSQQKFSGDWITTTGDGRQVIQVMMNQGLYSRTLSRSVSQQEVTEASRSAESAKVQAITAARERGAALSQAAEFINGTGFSSQSTSGLTSVKAEELSKQAAEVDKISQHLASETGSNTNDTRALLLGVGINVGVQGSDNLGYSSALSQNERRILNQLSDSDRQVTQRFAESVTRNRSLLQSASNDSRTGESISANLSEATRSAESTSSSYQERLSHSERLTQMHSSGEIIEIDVGKASSSLEEQQRFAEFARQHGYQPEDLRDRIRSELGEYQMTPHPIPPYRDESRAPNGREDVKSAFARHSQDAALSADRVDSAHRENLHAVPKAGGSSHPSRPDDRPGMPEGQLTVAPDVKPGQGREAFDRWGETHGVRFDERGQPVNERSFGGRNAEAAGRDLGEGAKAAKRLIDAGERLISSEKEKK